VPFISSIRVVPFIPGFSVPSIPSIKRPSIPHPTAPVAPRHTPPKEQEFMKQTSNVYLNSRDGNPNSRGDIPVSDRDDQDTTALQPTLQTRQGNAPASISGRYCTPLVCSLCCLSGPSSQGCTMGLPNTKQFGSFPGYPIIPVSDEIEYLPAINSAMDATGSAMRPVTHIATAILDPPQLRVGHSTESVHGFPSFPGPSCTGASNTASGGK
jgi:hypothetical protein